MDCGEQLIELRFPACADRLKLLRSVVRDAAETAGFDRGQADNIVLAVNEACMNVIQHGYREEGSGEIRLGIHSSGQALVFHLADDAPKVDEEKVCSRDLEDIRPGGLGVYFINHIMDETLFLEPEGASGNLFRMVKYRND